jgi:hypothetical protein
LAWHSQIARKVFKMCRNQWSKLIFLLSHSTIVFHFHKKRSFHTGTAVKNE